ncbi:MAG: AAA family ATPase [Proteobacteria bacterium]|nr:AAA family ATPase [Pseudomonadota bacterium]
MVEQVTAAERLRELLGYVEQVVRLDEQAAFKLNDYRLPNGATYQFPQHQFHALPGVKHDQTEDDGPIWLIVDRLNRSNSPAPPKKLAQWIETSNDPEKRPVVHPFILFTVDEAEKDRLLASGSARAEDCQPALAQESRGEFDIRVRLEDSPEVAAEADAYIAGPWLQWAQEELPRRRCIALYQRLFELAQYVELGGPEQAIEIVWGIGQSRWTKDKTLIDLPLLERLVEIEIDEKAGGSIRIRPRQADATINLRPYEELRLDGATLAQDSARRGLALATESDGVSPFARETFEPVLRACQSQLDPEGRYLPDSGDAEPVADIPAADAHLTVTDRWVIFARRRSDNFILKDLENLRASIERNKDDLPGPAKTLVMGPDDVASEAWMPLSQTIGESVGTGDTDEPISPVGDLFFPKPFNDAQVEIIRRLDKEDGVVVQGPPGTGKTHTIANIICHYLATGRRVLVVSHAEPALSVLREKLPEGVRDLAISITTSEREGLKQVEGAVRLLQRIVQELRPGEQSRVIRDLEQSIVRMRRRLAAIDGEMAEVARTQLTQVPGRNVTPAELAKAAVAARDSSDWFDDRPTCFLSETGLERRTIEEMRSQRLSLGTRIEYLGEVYPSISDLPSPQTMTNLHEDISRAQDYSERAASSVKFSPRIMSLEAVALAEQTAVHLEALIEMAAHFERHPWLCDLSVAGKAAESAILPAIVSFLDAASKHQEEYRAFVKTPVSIPDIVLGHQQTADILNKLAAGENPFGIFAFAERKAKPLIEQIRYIGRSPQSADEWSHVQSYFHWRGRQSEIEARWSAIAADAQLPTDYAANQSSLGGLVAALNAVLRTAPKVLDQIEQSLPQVLVKAPGQLWPDRAVMGELRDCLRNASAATKLSASRAEVSRVAALFDDRAKKLGPLVSNFFEQVVGKRGVEAEKVFSVWSALLATIKDIADHRAAFLGIEEGANRVEAAGAPKCAERIRGIPAVTDDPVIPGNWDEAWDWAASMSFLLSSDKRDAMRKLAAERATLDGNISETYERLVRERTFYALTQTMTGPVKAALMMFAAALRKIGAGKSLGAARHRRAAQQAMSACYGGVPCWIMPSWRVAEQLPGEVGTFDLVIMDEASQSDVKEVATLLRGKKVLVVGDDKQVSPTAAFIENAKIDRLERTYLSKQPFKTLLLPGASLYDLAKVMFPDKFVMLREHFRCVEPIIGFSAQFYTEGLIPLRVPTAHERIAPPLVDIYVGDGARSGDKLNLREVEVILDEIGKIIETPHLATKGAADDWRTIGIISLIGSKQAALINRMVLERFGEEVVLRHRIACGDSATFQGDERDIIFLSMVADSTKKQAQTATHFEQRFNVAMSRARDRLYLVRSVREDELNPRDLKAAIIRHMREPMKGRANVSEDLEALCDSDFERDILRRLLARGYRVTPQVGAMGYSIDMVVEGDGNARLAIECDGDTYHGPERWADDMARQRVLERVGWKFWRCWASSFTVDPDGCMADLLDTLDRMGIAPGGDSAAAAAYTEHREIRSAEARVLGAETTRTKHQSEPGIRIGDRIIIRLIDEKGRTESLELTEETDDIVNGFVSVKSSLGQHLLGASQEDEIEYDAQGKTLRALILEVERREAKAA